MVETFHKADVQPSGDSAFVVTWPQRPQNPVLVPAPSAGEAVMRAVPNLLGCIVKSLKQEAEN